MDLGAYPQPLCADTFRVSASIMHAVAFLHYVSKPAKSRGSILPGKSASDECECSIRQYDVNEQICGESFPWGALHIFFAGRCRDLLYLVPHIEQRVLPILRCGGVPGTGQCMYGLTLVLKALTRAAGSVYVLCSVKNKC